MTTHESELPRRSVLTQGWRYTLAGVGIVCVGVGAIGAFVPGLPTTIFLIIASACFAKSCPWLEDRLLKNRLFEPYMRFVNGERAMTRRERLVTLLIMWTFVTISVLVLTRGESPNLWIVFTVVIAAAIGTGFVIHWNPRATKRAATPADCPVTGRCGSAEEPPQGD